MKEVEITDVFSGKSAKRKNEGKHEFSRETGFPSPARDHYEKPLSLDEHLVHRPAATYFVRVKGSNMQQAGIYPEDLLVVDRSIKPASGHIVVVLLNGEHTIRQLERRNGNLYFCCGDESEEDIPLTNELDYSIWGVVSYAVHKHI